MHVIDFHIPSRLIPSELHAFDDEGIIVFPSNTTCSLMSQFHNRPSLGVVFFKENEEDLTPQYLQKRLSDIITLLGMAFPSSAAHNWLTNEWLFIHNSPDRITEFHDAKIFAQERQSDNTDGKHFYQEILNFELADVPQIIRPGPKYSLHKALESYFKLNSSDKTKELIKLFSFAVCSTQLIGRYYNNQNLKLSFMWTVLDAIMPGGTIVKETTCEECGNSKQENKPKPTSMRIEEFVNTIPYSDEDRELMIKFLKKLNKKIRSPFFHSGKTVDLGTYSKKNRGLVTFKEDIEQAEGRIGGDAMLEYLLRLLLFGMLDAIPQEQVPNELDEDTRDKLRTE